jgi:Glyoxalase-like domain
MISRRDFLIVGGLIVLRLPRPQDGNTPTMLDHILLGCNSRDRGIAFVEQHTGVRAAIGGVHPGRGTCNALLSLGERRYLEIIALDPAQKQVPEFAMPLLRLLKSLDSPRLVGWAVHPGNIEALADKLRQLGIVFDGPRAGSRARPDGRVLKWKTINLADDRQGTLPFFIEWDVDSPHPSMDTPEGCRLQRFEIADPDPQSLREICKHLELDVTVEQGSRGQIKAIITGPRGTLDTHS